MHVAFRSLNALLCLARPMVAAILVRRRLGLRREPVGRGAATFLASQVVHIPLNWCVSLLWTRQVLPPQAEEVQVWMPPLGLGARRREPRPEPAAAASAVEPLVLARVRVQRSAAELEARRR